MLAEQNGQYCFEEINGTFSVQKKPLGIVPEQKLPKFRQVVEQIKKLPFIRSYNASAEYIIPLDTYLRDPVNYEEMNLLHDSLLRDLQEKGIAGIIARETNVNPQDWVDHEKKSTVAVWPERKADNWEVDVTGPKEHFYSVPSGRSRWEGGCVDIKTLVQNELKIQLSIGEEWDERTVDIYYDRHRQLVIKGAQSSRVDLNSSNSLYLVQEHLRDAMANPHNPYYEINGFMSPALTKKHFHEHLQKQNAA